MRDGVLLRLNIQIYYSPLHFHKKYLFFVRVFRMREGTPGHNVNSPPAVAFAAQTTFLPSYSFFLKWDIDNKLLL